VTVGKNYILGSFVYSTNKKTGGLDLNFYKSKITGFGSPEFSASGFTLNWADLKYNSGIPKDDPFNQPDAYKGVRNKVFNGNDIFKGSSESDMLYGLGGNDKIYGFAGSDYLHGGAGNDYIDGGEGNDIIRGGEGNNTLVGGKGSDIFEITKEEGTTIINDFAKGIDKIKITFLDLVDLYEGLSKVKKFSGITKVKKFSGVEGEFIATITKSVTTISFDGDGNQKADVVFKLRGSISVTADDFIQEYPVNYQIQIPNSISFVGLKSAGSAGTSVPLPNGQSSSSQILGALTGTKQGQVLPV